MARELNCIEKVYHGSSTKWLNSLKQGVQINYIDARSDADFGKGFYTTTNLKQAIDMAIGRATFDSLEDDIAYGMYEPIILVYEIDISKLREISELKKGYEFTSCDEAWIDFIYNNRLGSYNREFKAEGENSQFNNLDFNYTYVYGDVADAGISDLVREVCSNRKTYEDFKIRLQSHENKDFNQLSVHDNIALTCFNLLDISENTEQVRRLLERYDDIFWYNRKIADYAAKVRKKNIRR